MPRPKKKIDLIVTPLEVATGKLSSLQHFNQPLTHKRIEQAIERHPDLEALLRPVLAEMQEHATSVLIAKAAIATAKKLIVGME